MKMLRFLAAILTVCLLATGMTACEFLEILEAATTPLNTEPAETAPNCDMNAVKDEIEGKNNG